MFLHASTKSLTNYENPSNNPLQEACSGFQIAAFDSKKLFRKPPVIQKIVQKPAVTCTLEAITNDSKGKLDQNL